MRTFYYKRSSIDRTEIATLCYEEIQIVTLARKQIIHPLLTQTIYETNPLELRHDVIP